MVEKCEWRTGKAKGRRGVDNAIPEFVEMKNMSQQFHDQEALERPQCRGCVPAD